VCVPVSLSVYFVYARARALVGARTEDMRAAHLCTCAHQARGSSSATSSTYMILVSVTLNRFVLLLACKICSTSRLCFWRARSAAQTAFASSLYTLRPQSCTLCPRRLPIFLPHAQRYLCPLPRPDFLVFLLLSSGVICWRIPRSRTNMHACVCAHTHIYIRTGSICTRFVDYIVVITKSLSIFTSK
jgi:hypothetical protein